MIVDFYVWSVKKLKDILEKTVLLLYNKEKPIKNTGTKSLCSPFLGALFYRKYKRKVQKRVQDNG